MHHLPHLFLVALTFLGLNIALPTTAAEPPFRHDTFGRVLRDGVKEAQVDYAWLKARPADLDAYLDQVAAVRPEAFARWPEPERLALLINLYNAQTLRLMVDHYPIASIKKIGFLPGSAWKRKVVRWGGRVISLDDLEHGILRKEYQEPRIHFALVCAARGCPPLREEPFVPDRLDEQLQDQGRRFLSETDKNRVEASTGTLWLSPIFEWFADDFTKGGTSLVEYVKPMLPEEARKALATMDEPRIRFTDYDWSLNDRVKP
jgi:hypothetical protein